MSEMKLLPSQSELVTQIAQVIMAKPSFVVLNGEEGSGKTFMAHYLAANGIYKHDFRTAIFRGSSEAKTSDVRRCIIKNLFNADIFDSNDDLSETARLFEIDQKNFLIIIDAIDYFDQNFLNELYRFYINYGVVLNLSVIITTSHILVDLINTTGGEKPKVFEVTISHLSPGEKISLLKALISRKVVADRLRDISFEELAEDCGSQPNEIVEFAENFVMNKLNGDLNSNPVDKNLSEPNQSGAIRIMNQSIKDPKGPNKILVIAVAVILTIALLGVIAMLLKKQPSVNEQEEVLVTTNTSVKQSGSSTISGDQLVEKQMVDGMIKGDDQNKPDLVGTNDDGDDVFGGNMPSDLDPPHPNTTKDSDTTENSGVADNQDQSSDSKVDDAAKDDKGVAVADNTSQDGQTPTADSKKDEIIIPVDPKAQNAAVDTKDQGTSASKSDDKTAVAGKNDKSDTSVKTDNTAKSDSAKTNTAKTDSAKTDKTDKTSKPEKADQQTAKKDEKTNTAKTDKKTEKPVTGTAKQDNKTTNVKPGVVYPLDEVAGKNGSTVKPQSTGNFVVQVACADNINALQNQKKKLGESAFIYERKNNALKYVLVVGYYGNRADAQKVAKKIGNGAWVKSVSAVRGEKKE